MDLYISLLSILGLLILSGFFSGSETAMTAASAARMHELERQGNGRAVSVNLLLAAKERMIGTILLGNNLVNILASALATSLFIDWVGEHAVVYATLSMTLLVLIFAEVLPKTYAINHADRMALAVAPVMRAIVMMLSPFVRAIQVIVTACLGMAGIRIQEGLFPGTSEEELRGAINLHQEGEAAEIEDERAMLHSILDLGDIEVGDIMTHRSNVVMLDLNQKPETLVGDVLASPHTRLPVYRGDPDDIRGVIHAKDLLRAVQEAKGDVSKVKPREIATDPWFIPESTTLLDQLRAFRSRHEHFAVVVDEYGALMGIVTLEDILEEIVGDIADEHDIKTAGIRKEASGAYIVDGALTIRDLNRELGWNLPDTDATTVAGIVMHEARRIPEVGQTYHFHGYRFEILRKKQHRVTALRIAPLENGAQPSNSPEPA
jgi:Mg2+/Co2+ transporter CorB